MTAIPTWAVVMSTILAFLGGYCLISFVLARKPTLIHSRRKRAFKARHISHRGGAAENLENTMSAFRHASSVGTDMFELDCHLTRDGEVVIAHDNSLDRLANMDGKISDLDYKALPPLSNPLEIQFDPGKFCHGEDASIMKLDDLFIQFPRMPMNIDVKVDDDELIAKVAELVKLYNREAITVWGSRLDVVADKLYKINPDVPQFLSIKASLRLLLLYWTGLLPFVPIRQSYCEFPMPSIFRGPNFQLLGNTWKGRALIFLAELLIMRKGLVRQLERRGISTFLWVLNTEEQFEEAFRLGVEGVMTDYPTRLTQFLEENSNADFLKSQ